MAGFWAWMMAHWFLGFILLLIGISGIKEIVLAILAPWRRLGAPETPANPSAPAPARRETLKEKERPAGQEPEGKRASRFDRL